MKLSKGSALHMPLYVVSNVITLCAWGVYVFAYVMGKGNAMALDAAMFCVLLEIARRLFKAKRIDRSYFFLRCNISLIVVVSLLFACLA